MCRAMCNFKRRETDRIVGTSSVKMCTRKRARPQSTQFATAICEYTYFSFFLFLFFFFFFFVTKVSLQTMHGKGEEEKKNNKIYEKYILTI